MIILSFTRKAVLRKMANQSETIVFDCDGVITDFTKAFYEWYNTINKFQEVYGPISSNPSNWIFDFQGDPQIIRTLVQQFINSNPSYKLIFDEMPRVLEQLKKKYRIVIVSHYPNQQHRVTNLHNLGILPGVHYDNIYCVDTTQLKIQTVLMQNPSYYVEDAPYLINHFVNNYQIPLLVPNYYNYTKAIPDHPLITKYDHPLQLLNLLL